MTAKEKRERRQVRHELQSAIKRLVVRRMGLFSTGAQLENSTQILADRFFAHQEVADDITPALEYFQRTDWVIRA